MPRIVPIDLVSITARKRHRNPHQPVGRWIRVQRRLALYMRDGFRCLCCDADLLASTSFNVTLDHVIRRVDGGTNASENLYTSCRSCNSARGDRLDAAHAKRIAHHTKLPMKRFLLNARQICAGSNYQEAFRAAQDASRPLQEVTSR